MRCLHIGSGDVVVSVMGGTPASDPRLLIAHVQSGTKHLSDTTLARV